MPALECATCVVLDIAQHTGFGERAHTEGGIFEARLDVYNFQKNIWVDFNLLLRFSSNSDGSVDLGEVF